MPKALRHAESVITRRVSPVRQEIWSLLRDEVKRAQEQERRNQLVKTAYRARSGE